MMILAVHALVGIVALVFLGRQLVRGETLESLPGVMWTLVLLVPFGLQWGVWLGGATHAAGLAWVGIAIVGADVAAARLSARAARTPGGNPDRERLVLIFMAGLFAVSVAIATYHIARMDQVPLLQALWGHEYSREGIARLRELSAKLLGVPRIVQYLFNWVVTVLAVIGIVALIGRRKYLWAAGWLVLASSYAVVTTAKGPLLYLVVAVVSGVVWCLPRALRRRVYLAAVGLLAVGVLAIAVRLGLDGQSLLNYRPAPLTEVRPGLDPLRTLADVPRYRAIATGNLGTDIWIGPGEYLLYRIFLGPVEVSDYWYAYFRESARRPGWQGILPWVTKPGYVHPSRRIALWAYRSRYPTLYAATANANAGVDADAYARFGMVGVVVAGLLAASLRLGLAWLAADDRLSQGIYGSAVALLAVLLPIASLQAVLVAQGLVMFPLALLVARRVAGQTWLPPLPAGPWHHRRPGTGRAGSDHP